MKFKAWHKERKKWIHFDGPWYCDEYNSLAWKICEEDKDPDGGDYGNLGATIDDFSQIEFIPSPFPLTESQWRKLEETGESGD